MRSDMPKDNLVLIDTSVWIDYFLQKNSELEQRMDMLLENAQVATAAIIEAELIQGSRGEREIKKLKEYFVPLHHIESKDEHWLEAGHLSLKLRQAGKRVNLTDCYIAALAKSASARIFSLDKHFIWIKDVQGCDLI